MATARRALLALLALLAAATPAPAWAWPSDPALVRRALQAASDALAFLEGQPKLLLDSVFGVALADGQLQDILDQSPDPELRALLEQLQSRAAAYVLERVPELLENEADDNAPLALLARPSLWRGASRYGGSALPLPLPLPLTRRLTAASLSRLLRQRSPTEPESDACLRGLLDGCRVSAACWRAMTARHAPHGYSLTHRLLFYSSAWRLGCDNSTAFTDVDFGDLITTMCGDILEDAAEIAAGDYPPSTRDLFTEQVVLCGLEGFQDFTNTKWLEEILSWQRPFGCFGNLRNLKSHKRRQKRTDMVGDYDCSMHFTGLAVAGITINVRDRIGET